MISLKRFMNVTSEPLKHTPVLLRRDADGSETPSVPTDRTGVARSDIAPTSGKILVSGVERYHGLLEAEIPIALWSSTQTSGAFPRGSNAYPGMKTRSPRVDGREVLTDSEGYPADPSDWSETVARAQAAAEGLVLTNERREVTRFPRAVCHPGCPGDGPRHDPPFPRALGRGKGQQPQPARDLSSRRTPEAGQPLGQAAPDQGRALRSRPTRHPHRAVQRLRHTRGHHGKFKGAS